VEASHTNEALHVSDVRLPSSAVPVAVPRFLLLLINGAKIINTAPKMIPEQFFISFQK
jgi:hypothetical protein